MLSYFIYFPENLDICEYFFYYLRVNESNYFATFQ